METDATFWDGIAEQYAAKPVEDPDAFDRKIAIIRSHITPRSVVLDVGCGTGSLALRLAPDAAEVHGLDLSGEMVRIAREKARDVPNVRFHHGTLDTAAFPPESVDVLCACSLLHLVPDRPGTLRAIHRLLKPGGVFVSSTVCLRDSYVPYELLMPVLRWLGKAPPVWSLSGRSLAQEIREAGFEAVEAPDVGAKPIVSFLVTRKPTG